MSPWRIIKFTTWALLLLPAQAIATVISPNTTAPVSVPTGENARLVFDGCEIPEHDIQYDQYGSYNTGAAPYTTAKCFATLIAERDSVDYPVLRGTTQSEEPMEITDCEGTRTAERDSVGYLVLRGTSESEEPMREPVEITNCEGTRTTELRPKTAEWPSIWDIWDVVCHGIVSSRETGEEVDVQLADQFLSVTGPILRSSGMVNEDGSFTEELFDWAMLPRPGNP